MVLDACHRLKVGLAHWLIRYGLRTHFRAIYLKELARPAEAHSAILFANHQYWWDGYLAYWLVCQHWRRSGLVWMEQMRRFPPFGALGALPFPADAPQVRATTIRRTLRELRTTNAILVLFPEGRLHSESQLLPFQRTLYWLNQHSHQTKLFPLAIYIESRYHQYPCAYLMVGEPFESDAPEPEWLVQARQRVEMMIADLQSQAQGLITEMQHRQQGFECILRGKLSLHERWQKVK